MFCFFFKVRVEVPVQVVVDRVVERKVPVPYPVYQPVEVYVPVEVKVNVPVNVAVPVPYPVQVQVQIDRPVPVYTPVAVPYDRPVGVAVPVAVDNFVAVGVGVPYGVPVAYSSPQGSCALRCGQGPGTLFRSAEVEPSEAIATISVERKTDNVNGDSSNIVIQPQLQASQAMRRQGSIATCWCEPSCTFTGSCCADFVQMCPGLQLG